MTDTIIIFITNIMGHIVWLALFLTAYKSIPLVFKHIYDPFLVAINTALFPEKTGGITGYEVYRMLRKINTLQTAAKKLESIEKAAHEEKNAKRCEAECENVS